MIFIFANARLSSKSLSQLWCRDTFVGREFLPMFRQIVLSLISKRFITLNIFGNTNYPLFKGKKPNSGYLRWIANFLLPKMCVTEK